MSPSVGWERGESTRNDGRRRVGENGSIRYRMRSVVATDTCKPGASSRKFRSKIYLVVLTTVRRYVYGMHAKPLRHVHNWWMTACKIPYSLGYVLVSKVAASKLHGRISCKIKTRAIVASLRHARQWKNCYLRR